MLFSENTEKVRIFEVMPFVRIKRIFEIKLKYLNVQYTKINDNTFILYNVALDDVIFRVAFEDMTSFVFGENKIPSEISVYSGVYDGYSIKSYNADKIRTCTNKLKMF